MTLLLVSRSPLHDGRATRRRLPDFRRGPEGLTPLAMPSAVTPTQPTVPCAPTHGACQKVLAGLSAREQVSFRVAPTHLTVDDAAMGAGTAVEHELARRLHARRWRASIQAHRDRP
jgi:hypothetical protein